MTGVLISKTGRNSVRLSILNEVRNAGGENLRIN